MTGLLRFLTVLVCALAVAPAAALAQESEEMPEQPRSAPRQDSPIVVKGPCFDTAAASMPDGRPHDHADPAQHRFSCGFRQDAYLPLTDVLAARPDVMIGESDVKADVAAVAVAYPEAGILTFDVKDPTKPKFLSWYRGGDCDTVVLDTDCGAYVSLSDDGKLAFLSIQAASPLGNASFNGGLPTTVPGIQVISLDDPSAPLLTDYLPVAGVNGVHTTNYHRYDDGSEYVFMTQNSVGIGIARIDRAGPLAKATQVGVIQIDEVHDTFLQKDPLDGKDYLYVAAGNTSGFYVYDVSDPLSPVLKSEWDLAPECHKDWYAHTIDVAVRNGRRYVTMPTESFFFGAQDSSETEQCGTVYGNGDKPGVMWIVDATNLDKLGPANATDGNSPPDPQLAANSKAALVATWSNAANAAGGNLKFSAHNQQIVGDDIYLSQYHGGVVRLNAAAAFAGRHERPYEEGVVTPSSGGRPIFHPSPEPVNGAYISNFFAGHPDVWDMNVYKGEVLAYDEHGGMYAFRPDDTAGPGEAGAGTTIVQKGCKDVTAPAVRGLKVRLTRRGVTVSGRASDRACKRAGTVTRVSVAIARKVGSRCAPLLPSGRFARARSCSIPGFAAARGTARFTRTVTARLPRGRYVVVVQAADRAGNLSRGPRRTARL